jgi:hypothetical protein
MGDARVELDGTTFDASVPCPTGLQCNVTCPAGATTTITGTVYDPAVKNPLYNISVYVPAGPLQPLTKGVLMGADGCSCNAFFKSGIYTGTTTRPDGTFTLRNVPVGSMVPLVLQSGKWRRSLHVNVTQCQANAQPDWSLSLPATVAAGSDDSIPEFAVSTGRADYLECLLFRIGLPASEYVAGAGMPGMNGHVHIFSGGSPTGTAGVGLPETTPMPGAPPSYSSLWSTPDQLLPYDMTLLSCESNETYNANPAALEAYVNAGGRVFASHYHYAWFDGPTLSHQSYVAPMDWGSNLATWASGGTGTATTTPVGGIIDTTLNGSTNPFPKGVAFQQWLTHVGALGQGGVPMTELSIYQPRYNAIVGPGNKPSQAWLTSDPATDPTSPRTGQTLYFSFNTPVSAPPGPGGTPPHYCGRAVFSDLHAEGDPTNMPDTSPPPGGCVSANLSAQEKALEFMLFDLSGCVVPDSVAP